MSSTITNGQSLVVPVPTGESIAVSAIVGTYTLAIVSGANIGALATDATGSAVYGPYTPGNAVRVTAAAGAVVDFETGVNPTPDYRPAGTRGVPVSGNKTINSSDLDQVLDVSALATLTIPSDAVLGIAASDRVAVSAYQQTANATTWAASGSTLRGTAPTAAQYLITGLVHIGANEWAYLNASSSGGGAGARNLRVGRTGTKIFGLGELNTTAASAYGWASAGDVITFASMFDVETHFDEVALIYGNASNLTTLTINKATLAVGANAADPVNNAAFAAPTSITFGGATSVVIPVATFAMAGNARYFPKLVVSDWMPLSSVDRTDVVSARPLLYVRTEVTPAAGTDIIGTFVSTGTDYNAGTTNPGVLGRYILGHFRKTATTGVSVGTWGGSTPTEAFYILPIGYMYRARSGRVMTVLGLGDSITRGYGLSAKGSCFTQKAVQNINIANSSASTTAISPKPVDYIKCGIDTSYSTTWVYCLQQMIAANIIPTVAVITNGTPNEGMTTSGRRSAVRMSALLDEQRIYPMVWGSIPGAYSAPDDVKRLGYNTEAASMDVAYLDFNSVVSDLATPQNLQVSLRLDTLHPNDAGDSAMAGVLQPKLSALADAYFAGKTT